MVDAELPQDRGLKIVRCHHVDCGAMTDFVRFSVGDSRLEAATRQPDRKPLTIVVASISFGQIPFTDRITVAGDSDIPRSGLWLYIPASLGGASR